MACSTFFNISNVMMTLQKKLYSPRPAFSQCQIRRSANLLKFVNVVRLISKLQSCEWVCRDRRLARQLEYTGKENKTKGDYAKKKVFLNSSRMKSYPFFLLPRHSSPLRETSKYATYVFIVFFRIFFPLSSWGRILQQPYLIPRNICYSVFPKNVIWRAWKQTLVGNRSLQRNLLKTFIFAWISQPTLSRFM